jgi:hypothetical protein
MARLSQNNTGPMGAMAVAEPAMEGVLETGIDSTFSQPRALVTPHTGICSNRC